MTIPIIIPISMTLREAILSNHHSLQVTQPNQLHFIHTLKALITHLKQSQTGHERQIKHSPFLSIATVATHYQFFNAIGKELSLFIQYDPFLNLAIIIHPFTVKHDFSFSIKLNASSPALSFTNLSFILHLLDVRVVFLSITHIHVVNAESLIHLLSICIKQHAPTTGLLAKHIAFPSLSIIIQIQHLLMFDSTHLLAIHS